MNQPEMPPSSGGPVGAAAYETPTQGPRFHYQSVGIRFAATLVDWLVLGIIYWILVGITVGSVFSSVAPIAPAARGDINATVAQINATVHQVSGALSAGLTATVVIIIIVAFLYYTLLEGRYGQTLGKWFCKIKVVREADGAPISYGEAAIRTILRIIDGLIDYLVGAILIWTSHKKQRLGDRLAHTVVVQLCDVK